MELYAYQPAEEQTKALTRFQQGHTQIMLLSGTIPANIDPLHANIWVIIVSSEFSVFSNKNDLY